MFLPKAHLEKILYPGSSRLLAELIYSGVGIKDSLYFQSKQYREREKETEIKIENKHYILCYTSGLRIIKSTLKYVQDIILIWNIEKVFFLRTFEY